MGKSKQNKKTSPTTCFVFALLVLIIFSVFFTMQLSQESFIDAFAFWFVFGPLVVIMLITSLIVSVMNIHHHHHALSYISLVMDIAMIVALPFGLAF